MMKKILFVVLFLNFANLFTEFDFDKDAYKADEGKGFLLPREYAAQIRQNCGFILKERIFKLIEKLEKEGLSLDETKALEQWSSMYERMRCSSENLQNTDAYLAQLVK